MQNEQKETLFHLPLSLTAFDQFIQFLVMLDNVAQADGHDMWTYIWNKGSFIPAEAYKAQINHLELPSDFGWLWESCCQLKHKFFFWMLLINRLNT